MFLNGYDTPEYSWVKATAVSVRLQILFMTLQSTNNYTQLHADAGRLASDYESCGVRRDPPHLAHLPI
jgi:hypothetical protein